MRHLLLAALCSAALVTGISRQASASCAGPSIVFAPADGSQVEPGVTWVFVPNYLGATPTRITVRSAGQTLPAAITRASRNDTFTTYRVAVDPAAMTGSRGTVHYTIEVREGRGDRAVKRSASYRLAHQDVAKPPAAEPVQLLDPSYQKSAWTCSHTDKITATPSELAPAYRLEWAATEDDYRRGIRQTLVVPSSMRLFWNSRNTSTPPDATLQLGHISCFGETIPADALASTIYLGIVPLRGDDDPGAPEHPILVQSGDPLRVEYLAPPAPEVPEDVADASPEHEERYICGYALARMQAADSFTLPFGTPFGALVAMLGLLLGVGLGGRVSRNLSETTVTRLDAWSLPQLALVGATIVALLPLVTALGGAPGGASGIVSDIFSGLASPGLDLSSLASVAGALWPAPLILLAAAVAAISGRIIRSRVY